METRNPAPNPRYSVRRTGSRCIRCWELEPVKAIPQFQQRPSEAPPRPRRAKPAKQGFPTAKDLVARFLFSRADEQANLTDKAGNEAYGIEFLIATVPDPINSRLPNFFDSFAESIGSAAEAAGYTLDRFALPWMEKSDGDQKSPPLRRQTLYGFRAGSDSFSQPP